MDVASDAARLFFPHSQALGIRPDDTASPAVLRKMVYAGSHARSFQQASKDLEEEAELKISAQRIMRATKRIGQERVGERNAQTEAWAKLSLPEQQGSPREQVPQVACVEMDGGRLQIRNRKPSEEEVQRTKRAGFWREDKVGCLLSMASAVSQKDPCPQIPQVFVDRERMRKISREIKGFCVSDEEAPASSQTEPQSRPGQPEVLLRSVVATREDVHTFGKQLAAAAWQRGFAAAPRKAFVADGQDANWTVSQALLPLHADPGFHPCDLLCLCGGHGGTFREPGLAGLLSMGTMGLERTDPTGDRGVTSPPTGVGLAGEG
jgi:hypothetical protein